MSTPSRTQRPARASSERASAIIQRRSSGGPAAAGRGSIFDFGCAATASPVQLEAFDDAIQRLQRNIQAASGEVGEGPTVQQAAAAGIASGGGQIPHAAALQRAFGKHDIGGIQAHVGGAAKGASEAMGAEAYATGDHVAFGKSPDLHTAAHEAAHVIQQRAGVQLAGGVGKVGDVYERHADEVADAVVQGKSAEGILDKMAGGESEGRHADGHVQRSQQARGRESGGDLQSDWAGRAIVLRWLTGGGDWNIANDGNWTKYMQDSSLLADRLRNILLKKATLLRPKVGTHALVQPPMSMEMENGEGIVGHQYLHGTDMTAGGFVMGGTARVSRHPKGGGTSVEFSMSYTWNDMIDPNHKYSTDTWKSILGRTVSLGMAKDYKISIAWRATTRLDFHANGRLQRMQGWPW